jgi:hypothetical protein
LFSTSHGTAIGRDEHVGIDWHGDAGMEPPSGGTSTRETHSLAAVPALLVERIWRQGGMALTFTLSTVILTLAFLVGL